MADGLEGEGRRKEPKEGVQTPAEGAQTPAEIVMRPIGVIHSEHTCIDKTPVQPVFAQGCTGLVEIYPEYAAGLQDIEGFSHIYLLFHMDRAQPAKLIVKPFLEDVERGIFATRSCFRPNGIGLSVVELVRREGDILFVEGVDILDGTPLLDVKPYTARFDYRQTTRNGWQDPLDERTVQERGRQGYRAPAAAAG